MPVSNLDAMKNAIMYAIESLLKDTVDASLDPLLRINIILSEFSEKGFETLLRTEPEKSDIEYALSLDEQLNGELTAEEIVILAKIRTVVNKTESVYELVSLFDTEYVSKVGRAIRLPF